MYCECAFASQFPSNLALPTAISLQAGRLPSHLRTLHLCNLPPTRAHAVSSWQAREGMPMPSEVRQLYGELKCQLLWESAVQLEVRASWACRHRAFTLQPAGASSRRSKALLSPLRNIPAKHTEAGRLAG